MFPPSLQSSPLPKPALSWERERTPWASRLALFGTLGFLLLAGLGWLVCSGSMSKEEAELSRLIDELAAAASNQDLAPIAAHLSPDFRSPQGHRRDSLLRWLDAELQRGDWSDVMISRRSIEFEEGQGLVDLTAVLSRGGETGAQIRPHQIRLVFAQEEGLWMVRSAEYRHAQVRDFFR